MRQKYQKAELAILLSCVIYSFASLSIRLLAGVIDSYTISFIRFAIGIFLGILFIKATHQEIRFNNKKYLFFRGLFGSASMILVYLAIQLNSSGRAIILSNTYPVFVAIFGFIFFKERISKNTVMCLFLCIIGILLIFYDHSKYSILGDICALASGALGGISVHYIKKSRETNNSAIVYMAACIFGLVVTSVPAVTTIHSGKLPVTFKSWGLVLLIGVLAFSGQLLMTYGYKFVAATKGSIFGLTEIVITLALSYSFVSEKITTRFIIGFTILLAGLFLNKFALFDRKESINPDL